MTGLPPPDWPYASVSRIVKSRPHRWHVQETGAGPQILLLHGAGGSTHSFRGLMAALEDEYRLIALDLPGQGFSQLGTRLRCGLDPIADDIVALCDQEGWRPSAVIGHSAGAALALRLAPGWGCPVVSLNGALEPFEGVAGWLFPFLARILAVNPLAALAVSQGAAVTGVQGMLATGGTGLDPTGAALYGRLIAKRAHVDATLAMMAQWDLRALGASLPQIGVPVLLIAGERDRAVPPEVSARAAARLPAAQLERVPGQGHLLHEVAVAETAARIARFLTAHAPARPR